MSAAKTSMLHRNAPLAIASTQLQVLSANPRVPTFSDRVLDAGVGKLVASGLEVLQVNLGKLCNMTCSHCHVDAGPDRREIMQKETIDQCLDVLRRHPSIKTVDLTGGAPEMNPHFRHMVQEARLLGRHVIDRCNLTILLAKGYEGLSEFLATHQVEIVASLPCYLEENADAQRGDGAFAKSVEALRELNHLGYGTEGSGLTLTLVYNPVGPSLPPNQEKLQATYRRELEARYGIRFNQLFTITNMPISRYLDHLIATSQFEEYMQILVEAFNPAALSGLMCRSTLSVGWDGRLFDCDFNQMLDMEVGDGYPSTIDRFAYDSLCHREIVTSQHCFGCTAGAGSGCQGAISN
ncbi:arsenosugar biosynthesis radical SAM (seleno)protein ArsS [Adhaeretor mobilis]|uniref:Molybdenum cofactor biosynthesis protein A n=1 Tax=Adhaeretor mobilis TaxID=1930276 RepID=A0A517N0U3_9BACT|nr:arsenosugar biosynthesis radical SAM (seleno)protein ArsS [Adhaeretor mobilis]QDT00753.1 molybdenum cofactor biosynthesis protein A [Adhaeretor mobilis]